MITIADSRVTTSKDIEGVSEGRELFQFVGLSTDTKPTVNFGGMLIANGSTLFTMDDSKSYIYDEEGGLWFELGASGVEG